MVFGSIHLNISTFKMMRNKGFTLVELLVVIAIIGILSAIVMPGYGVFQRQLSLQRSATKLAQDIRRAQAMAIAAEELPSGGVCKTGYGVYFDEDYESGEKYRLYADTSGENEFFTLTDTVLETIELEKGIYISDIAPNGKVSVNFKPPDPTVKISEAGTDLTETIITLCIKGTDCSSAKNIGIVTVNKAGLIDVD